MNGTGFVLRAPWYSRIRENLDLRSPEARRPLIQMYDNSAFVDELLRDPADSLTFGDDDTWSYPVPVKPTVDESHPRLAFATSRLIATDLRKLYQPIHERYYVVVVEVFCDAPGLPRAGGHDDITVEFRMRRRRTSLIAKGQSVRQLATNLLKEMAAAKKLPLVGSDFGDDINDMWWAHEWRRRFTEDNKAELEQIDYRTDYQQWLTMPKGGGRWRTLCDEHDAIGEREAEETFPMWRLPVREDDKDCVGPETRSVWFGIVPTYSGEHWLAPQPGGGATQEPGGSQAVLEPKLDGHAIYEIECLVLRQRPNCPPQLVGVSAPTEPFRLADPMDPSGTKNRTVTITLPDLRRLAARAGETPNGGGVRVVTPPGSRLRANPRMGIPEPGSGRVGTGGGAVTTICTFAIELFFIVAFFLFLMFLPIIVLAFQLWWLLALRFCIPPGVSFDATADFLATADLNASADLRAQANIALGTDLRGLPGDQSSDMAQAAVNATNPDGTPITATTPDGTPIPDGRPDVLRALVHAADPSKVEPPAPPPHEASPDDPLCRS